jgi:peptidoglycan/LPS O-acetylase OafA/YrhL
VVLRRVGSIPLILLLWLGSLVAARTSLPLLSYFPCFMGGVLAYQMAKKKTMKLGGAFWLLALLTSIVVFLFLRQRFRAAYLPECVFCLVIGAMVPHFKEFTASTFTQACHVIAKYSYGIYLFHLPVIWFVFFKLKMWPLWAQWSALGGLMWLVPWAAYHYLEFPLIQVGRNLTSGARPPERLAAEVSWCWTGTIRENSSQTLHFVSVEEIVANAKLTAIVAPSAALAAALTRAGLHLKVRFAAPQQVVYIE